MRDVKHESWVITKAYYSIGEDPIKGYTDNEKKGLAILTRVRHYLRMRELLGNDVFTTELYTAGKSTKEFEQC